MATYFNSKITSFVWSFISIAVIITITLWVLFKPIRVLIPKFSNITCIANVCIDDTSRYSEALRLYEEAIQLVNSNIGQIKSNPQMVFCSTEACSLWYGLNKDIAFTISVLGIVISDRGWHPQFIRHEIIHHLQNERLGNIIGPVFKPKWFKEGMAYSLSQISKEPRAVLLEREDKYRSKFEIWYEQVGIQNLWIEADRL